MVKIIMIFVISIIFFVIAAVAKPSVKTYEEKSAVATIKNKIYSESANVKYYVEFFENGKKVTAQTGYYSSSAKSLDPDEKVEIRYYYTEKNIPVVRIHDERVIPCAEVASNFYKYVNAIGVVLLIVAVISLVKKLLF